MARAEPQRSELRDMLQAEMRKLPRSLRIAGESSKPVTLDRQSLGRLSRTDALQSQGMSQRLEARDGERMAWLRRALGRLDAGACAICGGDIALDRLGRLPGDRGVRAMRIGGMPARAGLAGSPRRPVPSPGSAHDGGR